MNNPGPSDVTKRHLRGSALLVSGRVFAIALNFLVQVMTVRYLAKADFGLYAFAFSITTVASVVCTFGLAKAASKFLAGYLQREQYNQFWHSFRCMFCTVASLSSLFVFAMFAAWWQGWLDGSVDDRTQILMVLLVGLTFCDALSALFVATFGVLNRPFAIFIRRHSLGPLLKFVAATLVVISSGDVYWFAAGQLAAGALGLVLSVYLFRRIIRENVPLYSARKEPSEKTSLRELYLYGGTILFGNMSFLARTAMVPILLGLAFVGEQVAAYQAVLPLARLSEFVIVAVSVLFIPSAAMLAERQRQNELQHLYQKTITWVTLASYPIFAFTFLGADVLPVWLFGASYQSSNTILAWLAIGFFANAAFGANLRLLRAVANVGVLILVDGLSLIAGLGILLWLIPQYGAVGAAWAVCAAYLIDAMIYQLAVAKTTVVNPFLPKCVVPFVVGLGLAITVDWIRRTTGLPAYVGLLAACVLSIILPFVFWKDIELFQTFPELSRARLLRMRGGTSGSDV